MRRIGRGSRSLLVVALAVGVWSCDGGSGPGGDGGLHVVTAFYPLEWAVEEVGGDAVSVNNLTAVGAEPHDLELTPAQRDEIEDADVVFVMGNGFQPAVEEAADERDGPTVEVFAELASLHAEGRVVESEHDEGDDDASEEDGGDGQAEILEETLDPHVWLDPVLMAEVVGVIETALAESAPDDAENFAANAATLEDELATLDAEYTAGLAECETRVLVTAHDAFGYLTARYNLRAEGVAGISPDAEPDPARLAELADLVEVEGVSVVFTEELVSPEIAETLASEAGVDTDVLSPLEGLSADDAAADEDYLTVMRTNLDKIRNALRCS